MKAGFVFSRSILLFCSLLFISPVFASISDSLQHELDIAANDSVRCRILLAKATSTADLDYDNAINLCELGLKYAKKAGFYKGIGLCYAAEGDAYYFKGDIKKSLEYYLHAIRVFEKYNYPKNVAASNRQISAIYQQQKNFKAALEYMDKALKSDIADNYEHGLVNDYFRLQTIYGDMKDNKTALNFGFKALELCKEDIMQSTIYANIATTYKDMGDIKNALIYADKALPVFKKENYSFAMAAVYQTKSAVYVANREYDKAKKNIALAENFYKSAGAYVNLPEFYTELSQAYEKAGKFKSALYWNKKSRLINDSLFTIENNKQIAELQLNFETEKNQKEIAQLNQRNLRQELKIGRNKLVRNGTLLALIFLAIAAILIYRNMRRVSRLNKDLNNKTLALENTNTVKDKLFSIISHDLRSPLNTIDAILAMMRRDDVTAEETKIYAAYLENSLDNTLNLLDNLLNWSVSQMNGLSIKIAEVNITAQIKEAIELYKDAAKNKHICLSSKMVDNIYVLFDVNVCRLVLRNLIHNAIKFTGEGGEITFDINENENNVELVLHDTGIGMTQSQINDAFKLKEGKSTQGTARESGTGLGLVLCYELIIKSGAEINIQSEINKGTQISIMMPKAVLALNELVA